MDDITALFYQGVDDYWRGIVPEGWKNEADRLRSPYLMGWWMVSMMDNDDEYINWRDE